MKRPSPSRQLASRQHFRASPRRVAVAFVAGIVLCCAPPPPSSATIRGPFGVQNSCTPISPQERWGVVVENPVARGYVLAAESKHFRFWTALGGRVREGDLEISEAHVALMERILAYSMDQKIEFFVYPDSRAVTDATGMPLLIRRDVFQLHLAESRHLHEVVHFITYRLAGHRTIPLLEEGFAEAYGNWQWRPGDRVETLAWKEYTREHVDSTSRRWLNDQVLPPLTTVLTDAQFRSYSGSIREGTYIFSASFVLFLVHRYGIPSFVDAINEICVEDSFNIVRDKLRAIYRKSVRDLECEWHRDLRADVNSDRRPAPHPSANFERKAR